MSPHSRPGLLFLLPWDLHHPGGVNQVVINLFHQARQSGRWHPIVCVNAWGSPKPQYREVDSRPTVYFRLRSPWNKRRPMIGLLAFLFNLPSVLITLQRLVAKINASVVNAHYPTLSMLVFSLLGKLGGRKPKVILSFHGLDIEHALESSGLERWLWRVMLCSADGITTCSAALKQRVLALEPRCEHKVKVIHNGLDVDLLRAERDHAFHLEPGLTNRQYLLNVATFERKKGQDVLIEAFRILAKDFPDLALVLVGRTGPTLSQLKAQAHDCGLGDRVFFYVDVPHSQVPAFFEHAKVFCLPSRDEPFGIVVLEAGAFGLPVVASQVGGVPEIIVDGQNGSLVAPDDTTALAEVLRRLMTNEEASVMLGQRLHNSVIERFTWARAFHEYEAALRNENK